MLSADIFFTRGCTSPINWQIAKCYLKYSECFEIILDDEFIEWTTHNNPRKPLSELKPKNDLASLPAGWQEHHSDCIFDAP